MDDKRKYRDLSRAIKETDREIDRLFDRAVRQVSALLTSSGADLSAVTDGALFLTLHPEIRDGIREIVSSLSADLLRSMQAGIVRGWDLAEEHASATIAAYIGNTTPGIGETLRRALLDRRRGAVTPFLRSRLEERVSDSVWRTAEQARHHITDSVAAALEEGLSADDLSRRIRQDLREPSRLFRRVRDKETGTLHLSRPAKAYHPGQGVARSSYKNAKRLARTEINIAYRTSDYERWQGKDFVLGFRIHLSGNHTCNGVPFSDICDDLEGVYPKTFKFTGWHPQCRCIATPILEDADHCFRRILTGEGEAPEPITDLPPQMDEWMKKNAARLRRADAWGTTPYWVRDNFSKEGKGKATLTGAGGNPSTPRTAGSGSKPPQQPDKATKDPKDLFYLYKDYTDQGGGRMFIDTSFTPEDKHQSDYYKIRRIGDHFAKQGCEVQMPKQHNVKSDEYSIIFGSLKGTEYWGKCPDLIVNGITYEFEGYDTPWGKKKVGRMIKHGLRQSPNVIIDNTKGCSHRFVIKRMHDLKKPVDELWVYEKGEITRLYKKQKATKR